MRQFKRSARIGEQVLRDISRLVGTEMVDETPGMITFTHVRVTDDLRYATVYYSCLGQDDQQRQVADFLEKEKKRIRHLVGKNLHLRYIPEFSFKYDPSVREGIRIERLLDEIKSDSQDK
ncbi:MAG: 30S ribosome-binding factor RbfA [Candidatus Zixiibacteriota bacterium]|nr:MAG: 30S ribosome-binding factor RbfA [candidate division Zixibacteria bacterium]